MDGIREILTFLLLLILMLGINFILFWLSKLLDQNDLQKRVFVKKTIIRGGLIPVAFFLFFNILSTCGKVMSGMGGDYINQNIIFERAFAVVMFWTFYIVKAVFRIKKNLKIKDKYLYPYRKDVIGEDLVLYYVDARHKKIGQELKIAAIAIGVVFSIGEAIFVYNNKDSFTLIDFIANYVYLLTIAIIYLIVYEMGVFLDGEVEETAVEKEDAKNSIDRFDEMLKEYKKIFKEHITLSLDKDEEIKNVEIKGKEDYIYSKIFTPAVEGQDIIIETENLALLDDIIPPLINLIFATNRKIVFITEDDAESNATYKWLRQCGVITDNMKIVVDVLLEDGEKNLLPDTNVNICIGTVDLLIENKEIIKNVDTVFSINIDNIIVSSSIKLSILTKILSETEKKKIQYILFVNQVNGLQQSIEGVFYRDDFLYQVVRQRVVKNFHSLFFAKEKGAIQQKVLPAVAIESLGDVVPLLITPLKYDFANLYAFSEIEPYEDEVISLHKNAPYFKVYVGNNNIIALEDKINFSANEHFTDNKDSMIVAYDDSENNLILLLNNYIKYATSRILVNIVSNKYLLRDYMIDNVDFFMQNHDYLGKIVPYQKEGKKIKLFKLINELILSYMDEKYLIQALNELTGAGFNLDRSDKAEKYVQESLKKLIEDVFGCSIYIDTYMNRNLDKVSAKEVKYTYKLSENIISELPTKLFTQVKFLASDQKLKVLKRLPLYEMYQNYAVGQYVVFDGKSYAIDRINERDGIVNLIYNDRIINRTYDHKKDVEILCINRTLHTDSKYTRQNIEYKNTYYDVDIRVNYTGYFEFTSGLSFEENNFRYQKNDNYGEVPYNEYKNHKGFLISFNSNEIAKMKDDEKLKISETMAFLLNEVFKTIYYGANQYLITRAIVKQKVKKYNSVLELYSPIVIHDFNDGIGLFMTEDTELEKGLLDSFTLKLDTTIIPLIIDYLEWLLDEDTNENKIKQMEMLENDDKLVYLRTYNKEIISFYNDDKLDYLRLGAKKVNDIFDLKNTLELLKNVYLSGNNSMTDTRKNYIARRQIVDVEKEKQEREAKIRAEREAKEQARREKEMKRIEEAKARAERYEREKEEKIAKKQAEKEAKEKAKQDAALEKLRKEEMAKFEKEKKEREIREAREKIKNEVWGNVESVDNNIETSGANNAKEQNELNTKKVSNEVNFANIDNESKNTSEKDSNMAEDKKSIGRVIKDKLKKYDYDVEENVTKEEVIEYLEKNIYNPILESDKDIENIGRLKGSAKISKSRINAKNWNVLSVVNYVLHSSESEQGKKIDEELKTNGLPCFEDYKIDFIRKFGVRKN